MIPNGYEQITGLSSKKQLTVPPGTYGAMIQAETQNVRWRWDGTDPTGSVGMILIAGDPPTWFDQNMGNLADLEFFEDAASGILNVQYFKLDR